MGQLVFEGRGNSGAMARSDHWHDASVLPLPFFVAASDATDAEKALASYQCDGVNDEVEINQATIDANAGPSGFAKVMLSSGTFRCSAKIDGIGSVTLEGMGGWSRATQVRVQNPSTFADSALIEGVGLAVLRGLYLTNPAADGTPVHLVADAGGSITDALFTDVVFDTNDLGAINFAHTVRRLVVANCGFLNLGFDAATSAIYAQDCRGFQIVGNLFFNDSGPYEIDLLAGTTPHIEALVAANMALNDAAGVPPGISLSNLERASVTGNKVGPILLTDCQKVDLTGGGVQVGNRVAHGVELAGCADCSVIGVLVEGGNGSSDAIRIGTASTTNNVQANTLRGSWANGWNVADAGSTGNLIINNDGAGLGFADAGTGTVLNLDGSANNWNRT